ncbi:NADH:flavin oxidoreductase/NADH oxidase-like protein [Jackrogersella minutella]|nr:NADH:flavin oxidoreductase/NADH oxidase-like protein [Jackrogersella minutella]
MPVKRYESAPVDVAPLGQPLKFEFSGRVAKNRFYKSAMVEDLATWSVTNIEERGIPTKQHIELYRRWGASQWGVICTGNMDIELDAMGYIGDAVITPECPPSGPRFEGFKEVAAAAKANGSLIIGQVNHPGRQLYARVKKDTIAPSAIQIKPETGIYAVPREATQADIDRVIEGFAHAAEYLQKAGFDGIQLHAAHGYLLAQFLSEQSNQRTDAYGGTLEKRMRIIVEIAEAIKRRVEPGFILCIKLNSVEFQEKGIQPAEARVMCEKLQELGFDFVELSGGTHENIGYGSNKESTLKREAYFLEFVRDIVPHLSKTKKFLTGGFRTAAAMVKALDTLDGIGLGRPATQEPRLPDDILAGRVTGAISPVDEILNDFVTHLTLSGAQIHDIGNELEPFDLSDPKVVEVVQKELTEYFGDKDELNIRAFPDLKLPDSMDRHVYGDAY